MWSTLARRELVVIRAAYLNELNNCCRTSSLDDLRFSGQLLSWTKGSGRTFLARKLDRALVNPEWLHHFPSVEASFLEPGASDHSPILVKVGLLLHIRRPPFRFFSFWVEHPNFEGLVSSAWNIQMDSSPQFCLARKLKYLKTSLKKLNKSEYDNISGKTSAARETLHQI